MEKGWIVFLSMLGIRDFVVFLRRILKYVSKFYFIYEKEP